MYRFTVALTQDRLGSPTPGGIGRYASELRSALAKLLGREPTTIKPPIFFGTTAPRLASWQFLRLPPMSCRADVVHATSLAIPPTSKPLVVTVHDLIFEKWPSAFTRWGLTFHKRGLRVAEKEAAVVITPTRAVAEELCAQHPAFEGRVVAIYHGVPSFCATESADEVPEKVRATNRPFPLDEYFLWVGTIEPRKNLYRLVQAFALLAPSYPRLSLVLAGKLGWKVRREALLQRVPARKGRERVVFFDDPDDSELRLLYQNCLAFVFPSLDEGFGFPLLEAMALGAPIVASDIPPIREVVAKAAVLVDPKRVGNLAEAMDALVRDRSLAHCLQEAGSERAKEFSWERSAKLHLEAYQKAVSR